MMELTTQVSCQGKYQINLEQWGTIQKKERKGKKKKQENREKRPNSRTKPNISIIVPSEKGLHIPKKCRLLEG